MGKNGIAERISPINRRQFYFLWSALVCFYFVIIPFCQTPNWCFRAYDARKVQMGQETIDCHAVSVQHGIRYSGFPTFSPTLTNLSDLVCLLAISTLLCFESKWRNRDLKDKARVAILVIALFISAVDLIFALTCLSFPYATNMLRVVILLTFSSSVRSACHSMCKDLRDSFSILVTIYAYMIVFVLTVYYFYRPTFEGI